MADWTHIFREAGNGFPQDGDRVICEHDGEIDILRIVSSGPILTRQWQSDYMYVVCEPTGDDFYDLRPEHATRLYDRLPRVSRLTGDEIEGEEDEENARNASGEAGE